MRNFTPSEMSRKGSWNEKERETRKSLLFFTGIRNMDQETIISQVRRHSINTNLLVKLRSTHQSAVTASQPGEKSNFRGIND
jgi:hypothetical protein